MSVEQDQVELGQLEVAAQQIWQAITRAETVLGVVGHCSQMDWPLFREPGLRGQLIDLQKKIDRRVVGRRKIVSELERRELFVALPQEGREKLPGRRSLPETVYIEIGPDGRSFMIKGIIELKVVLEKNAPIDGCLGDFREQLPGWEWEAEGRGEKGFMITGGRTLNEASFVASYASYVEVPRIENQLRKIRINI